MAEGVQAAQVKPNVVSLNVGSVIHLEHPVPVRSVLNAHPEEGECEQPCKQWKRAAAS
jgi:hypothetical protein